MRGRRLASILLVWVLILSSVSAQRGSMRRNTGATSGKAEGARVLPPIRYTEFKLPNGLRVILHEDHSTPIVAVNVWYHVGSKNEVPGKTGFAHLFEHMMFQGSKNYDDDYFKPIQEAGGTLNGSTNADRTNYWEVVPSNFLELALFMEADRMGGLLDALTEEKLNNQREVVKNEKRQNYDNRPYGLVSARIAELIYPPTHPYHWLTIGSLDDLNAASMEDVKAFFRRFYTPNNASLAIAGDFDPAEARRLVEKYFGPIARGPEVKPVSAPQPHLDHEIRETMQDRVSLARIYMVWHSVPQWTPDDAALDMLARILGGGRSSRLYKSLVYERQIAQDVFVANLSREIAGQFQIVATAKPGKSLAELERAIAEELAKIKSSGPTREEMERAYNVIEANFIYGLQTVGGFGGKSDQLNQYAIFLNNPGYFEEDLARYRRVTAQDVRRVANQYLTDKRLVLSVVPQAQRQGARREAKEGAPAADGTVKKEGGVGQSAQAAMAKLPRPKPDPKFSLPPIQRRRLSNGLEVLVVEHHELPLVQMNLVVKTGGAADPQDKAGLASLTADMLDEGTRTRSALEISDQFAAIGAQFNIGTGWDATSANLLTLTRHLDRALDLFADIITNPAFPQSELERLRAQRLASFRQRRDNAEAIAQIVYAALLYGRHHPYGHPLTGDEDSVKAIGVDDVRRFYETYMRPNNAALIVVGDVTPATIIPKLERAFANWKSGEVPKVNIPPVAPRDHAAIYLVDRPGAAQSVIQIGQVGVERSTPDYFPLLVLNTILGGQFVSRVNLNLRESKGYTYGARTAFDFRRGAGPFVASAGVFTGVTKESVEEFLKELRGIRGEIPITPNELEYAKQALIRGFPRGFETPGQIAGRLEDIVLYDLPDDYFNNYIARIRAVTLDDVNRVAKRYLDPSRMAILIVGDRQAIEPGLRSLKEIGTTITFVNPEGRVVAGEESGASRSGEKSAP